VPARSSSRCGRAGDVHARASTAVQAQLSAERLDKAWRGTTRDLGPVAEVRVSCRRPAGRVVADVTITYAGGAVNLRIGFEPSGQIAGLRFMTPQDEAPPLPD
jgi:hypothetical protein